MVFLILTGLILSGFLISLTLRLFVDRSFSYYLQDVESELIERISTFCYQYHHTFNGWEGIGNVLGAFYSNMSGLRRIPRAMSPAKSPPIVLFDHKDRQLFNNSRLPAAIILNYGQGIELSVDDRKIGRLYVGSMVDDDIPHLALTFQKSVGRTIIAVTFLLSVPVILFFLFFSKKMFASLTELTDKAAAIGNGDLNQTVTVNGEDELARAANAFNRMAQSLNRQDELRKQLLNDLAHDIRTPLTLLRGELEMLLEGVVPLKREQLQSLYQESDVILGLVQELRLLGDDYLNVDFSPLLLPPLLYDMTAMYQAALDKKKSAAQVSVIDTFVINGSALLLKRLFANLFDNSINYLPAVDGKIVIRQQIVTGMAQIDFIDNGTGIPPGEREKVFERLYRADSSRNSRSGGHGLGLAICRRIAEKHEGTIHAVSPPDGRGAIIRLRLPLIT